jgi:hypothetical protein
MTAPPVGAQVWPMGGSEGERAATLAATLRPALSPWSDTLSEPAQKWPTMANYWLTYGDSFWLTLNSWPASDWNGAALRGWLREALDSAEARRATWKFVVCYLPPFHSGTAYPDTQKMRVVADLFEAGGVDIVFSSYIHVYQRSKPLRFAPAEPPTGPVRDYRHEIDGAITTDDTFDGKAHTAADGVIYIVSGCGGQGLHEGVPAQTDAPATWQPFTAAFNGAVHGFSEVKVDGRRLEFWQRDLGGAELDRMTLTK